jgi:hypothetical protein
MGPLAVTVTARMRRGNTRDSTQTLTVDRGTTVRITGVRAATRPTDQRGEAADGIVITGTAEAGSTVTVNGVPATVAANGTYTATIPASGRGWPAGRHVTSTDAAGQHRDRDPDLTVDRGTTVAISRRVRRRRQHDQRGEAADGIVITGTAEAGSTRTVNGVPATVAATAPTPRRSRLRPRMARWPGR